MAGFVFPNKPWLIAHRGASAHAPENTLAAMQLAKKMGATWVEFDVALSKDGQAFIFHDELLTRTTNGRGVFAQTTAAQLSLLDAGTWFSEKYQFTNIPTLKELLLVLAELGLSMNLEIKPMDNRIELLVDIILTTLENDWPANLAPPLISSFSVDALRLVRARNKTIHVALLLDKWRKDWQVLADELSCCSIHLNRNLVTPARVAAIHSTRRAVVCYTVNDIKTANKLFAQGVDGVFSNYVDLLG